MSAFTQQAGLYVGVFALSTFAAVTYRFTEERLGLLWREWLTTRLLDRYMDHRAYHLVRARDDVGNPDQRIAEDTRTFVAMTLSFVLLLLNGIFTIVAFSGVLFSISRLLWGVAVVYAAVGSLATIGLGRSLVRMNYDQSDRDASLRSELIHVRENAESIGAEAPSTALFLASAGLWPTGEGTVERPGKERVAFVPARPYLTPGTLRGLLSGGGADAPSDAAIRSVLDDVGAGAVLARGEGLDVERDWDDFLGFGEQQMLVLARVALARPEFAFLYRIESTLGSAAAIRMLRLLSERSITCVTFSDSDALAGEHDVVLRLKDEGAWEKTT